MKALQITYKGHGSEKQVTWASDIFNREIAKIQNAYETAKIRVENGTMPEKWLEIWISILDEQKVINAIERFATQPAGDTISYKGLKTPRGSVSIAAIIEKLAIEKYNNA
jgi:hypothetical protein